MATIQKGHQEIGESVRSYERWLREHVSVVENDLKRKHAIMKEGPFPFLRGTFFRWIQEWPAVCPDLAAAPELWAVGDLHVENFGTWRDEEGRLVWGINDFDEACRVSYTSDLVRVAVSAQLAAQAAHLSIEPGRACEAILEGYTDGMETRGCPFVLEERNRWLRRIAMVKLRDPKPFWQELNALKSCKGALPPGAQALLRSSFPPGIAYRSAHRVAGVGSLGRPRFVALGELRGARIAREVKVVVPSAWAWIHGPSAQDERARWISSAVRMPDPFLRISEGWLVRRLSPDCSKVELKDLPTKRDEYRLLQAMGFETANVHLGTEEAREGVLADLKSRERHWLLTAARTMSARVTRNWDLWRHNRRNLRAPGA